MLYSYTVGTGQDLVLLHGWALNSDCFQDVVKQYKTQYRITVIDLPGHGRSDMVLGKIDAWCEEIIKILPKKPPILLGWSLGGLLAINIAQKIKLSKLILLASTPKFVKDSSWDYGVNAINFKLFSNALKLNLSKGLKHFIGLQTNNKAQIRLLHHTIDALPASSDALNQGLDILLNTDLREPLKQLTIPVHAILGDSDILIPVDIVKWYMAQNISTTVLDAGHLPFLHQDFLI